MNDPDPNTLFSAAVVIGCIVAGTILTFIAWLLG